MVTLLQHHLDNFLLRAFVPWHFNRWAGPLRPLIYNDAHARTTAEELVVIARALSSFTCAKVTCHFALRAKTKKHTRRPARRSGGVKNKYKKQKKSAMAGRASGDRSIVVTGTNKNNQEKQRSSEHQPPLLLLLVVLF